MPRSRPFQQQTRYMVKYSYEGNDICLQIENDRLYSSEAILRLPQDYRVASEQDAKSIKLTDALAHLSIRVMA